jgi:hypothetical protein
MHCWHTCAAIRKAAAPVLLPHQRPPTCLRVVCCFAYARACGNEPASSMSPRLRVPNARSALAPAAPAARSHHQLGPPSPAPAHVPARHRAPLLRPPSTVAACQSTSCVAPCQRVARARLRLLRLPLARAARIRPLRASAHFHPRRPPPPARAPGPARAARRSPARLPRAHAARLLPRLRRRLEPARTPCASACCSAPAEPRGGEKE